MRPSQRITLLLLLLITGAPLAGCLGGDGGGGDGVTTTATDAPGEVDAATAEAVPIRLDHAPVDATIWENGTMAWNDACFPVGCLTSASGRYQAVDITPHVPMEAPTRVRLTLEYDPAFSGTAYAFVSAPGGSYYTESYDLDRSGDVTATVEVVIGRFTPETVEAVVFASAADAQPSMDWRLRVDIQADPAVAPRGVPVAIEHAPGDTVTVTPADNGTDARIVVYGPDDALVDHFDVGAGRDFTLSEDTPAGEYVVVALAPDAGVRVDVLPAGDADGEAAAPSANALQPAAAPTMRALALDWVWSAPRDAPPGEEVTWTFNAPNAPLRAGLYITTDDGSPVSVVGDLNGELRSPAGTVVSVDTRFVSITVLGSLRSTWISDVAADALVPGAYEAAFQTMDSHGLQVGEVLVHYVR